MSEAEVRTQTRARPPAEVAPFIAAAVGDVGRPRAQLEFSRDLAHLPGEGGLFAGITNVVKFMRRGVKHLVEQRQRYGAVFRAKFGPAEVVHVSDPDLLLRVVRNEGGEWSAALAWLAYWGGLAPGAPPGMTVTMDFEPHRDARRILQPAVSPAATAGYVELASPLFEAAIDGYAARGHVLFKREIRTLFATAASRIFFGADREAALLDQALADVWGAPVALSKNRWLSATWRRAVAGYRRLYAGLLARVPERRAAGGTDLFSRLCAVPEDGETLADGALVELMIGTLLGAFDTTASGMTSMAYLLARHPEWQERLRRECLALGTGRVQYADLKRLPDTEMVWKETLRLFPVPAHIPRCALKDVELGGHRIPAGTLVHANLTPMMHDPRWWTEPERFDPERFNAERHEDRRHPGAYLPFGGGAHACIGMHLATVETKAFWHAMLTRCRFRLEPDYVGHHTYAPLGVVSGPVRLALEPL